LPQYVFQTFQSLRYVPSAEMQKQSAMPTKTDAAAGTDETLKGGNAVCALIPLAVHDLLYFLIATESQ
jgi:hypothetical protein